MPEVADILTYLVDESAKFHAALAGAVAKWSESGAVPPALLSSKKAKRAKSTRAKSGYSLFVADHIASLKKEGVTSLREKGKDYMSLAGAKWKTMSDAAKAAYNTQAKAEAAAAAGAGVLALAGGSGGGAEGEKKKKKKKKRDHEGGAGDEHKKHKKHKKHHDSD